MNLWTERVDEIDGPFRVNLLTEDLAGSPLVYADLDNGSLSAGKVRQKCVFRGRHRSCRLSQAKDELQEVDRAIVCVALQVQRTLHARVKVPRLQFGSEGLYPSAPGQRGVHYHKRRCSGTL